MSDENDNSGEPAPEDENRLIAERREKLRALRGHGIDAHAGDGINTWLRVADERSAIVELTAAGIRVAPGGPFQLGDEGGFVRVTVGVADDIAPVAEALAAAARA